MQCTKCVSESIKEVFDVDTLRLSNYGAARMQFPMHGTIKDERDIGGLKVFQKSIGSCFKMF